MNAEVEPAIDEAPDDYLQYRAVSSLAIMSLVAGLLSATALFAWFWIVIPIAGMLLGLCAWRKIKSRPQDLSGLAAARTGVGLSALFLVVGPGWLSFEYTHEVPDGYQRISYESLQPDINVRDQKIPPEALALEGQRVFIKGYVYPGQKTDGIKVFLLVRDQGDCCFGGNPKITDRIQVTLVDPLRLTLDKRLHGVAGVFHVRLAPAIDGIGGIYYQLDGDVLQ